MPIDALDRTAWSLDQAYRHIGRICRARHEAVTGQKVELDVRKVLLPAVAGRSIWESINLNASRQLWQALRQGNRHTAEGGHRP